MINYGQFCPVAQALEIVGERWTLLIVRELLCGNYRFNQILHGVPLMSRSLLAQRLRMLEEQGLLERCEREGAAGTAYRLTEAGRELEPLVIGLGEWGKRWARRKMRAIDLDPVLMMWDLHRRLDVKRLPAKPIVVSFWLRDVEAKRSRYWLRIQKPEVELCLTNPGLPVDLQVETTVRALVDVWMGDRTFADTLRARAIDLEGPAELVRGFPKWLKLSGFASVPRHEAQAVT